MCDCLWALPILDLELKIIIFTLYAFLVTYFNADLPTLDLGLRASSIAPQMAFPRCVGEDVPATTVFLEPWPRWCLTHGKYFKKTSWNPWWKVTPSSMPGGESPGHWLQLASMDISICLSFFFNICIILCTVCSVYVSVSHCFLKPVHLNEANCSPEVLLNPWVTSVVISFVSATSHRYIHHRF